MATLTNQNIHKFNIYTWDMLLSCLHHFEQGLSMFEVMTKIDLNKFSGIRISRGVDFGGVCIYF